MRFFHSNAALLFLVLDLCSVLHSDLHSVRQYDLHLKDWGWYLKYKIPLGPVHAHRLTGPPVMSVGYTWSAGPVPGLHLGRVGQFNCETAPVRSGPVSSDGPAQRSWALVWSQQVDLGRSSRWAWAMRETALDRPRPAQSEHCLHYGHECCVFMPLVPLVTLARQELGIIQNKYKQYRLIRIYSYFILN
jgi:hypothetical protein